MFMEAERKCEELIRFKPRAGSKGEKKKKRTGESGGGMGGQGGGTDFIVSLWQEKMIQGGVGMEKQAVKLPRGERDDYGKW